MKKELEEGDYNKVTDPIRIVEDFIEKMRTEVIKILDDKAQRIIVDYKGVNVTLAIALANSLTDYMLEQQVFPSERETLANVCIGYMNLAQTNGVIEQNREKLQRKIEELQKQIEQKDKEIVSHLSEIQRLTEERDGAVKTANSLQEDLLELKARYEEKDERVKFLEKTLGGYNKVDD
jgi:chromosome segregation ATPase